METTVKNKTNVENFVNYLIERCKRDTGFAAAIRRANNHTTEYYSWEYLSKWCDLDKEWEFLPYATVGASLAEAKPEKDGIYRIGKSIALCYEDGKNADGAKIKLRRLIACDNIRECCLVLRGILKLILSHGIQVSYTQLLKDLLYFNDKTKISWAIDFYGRKESYDTESF